MEDVIERPFIEVEAHELNRMIVECLIDIDPDGVLTWNEVGGADRFLYNLLMLERTLRN